MNFIGGIYKSQGHATIYNDVIYKIFAIHERKIEL